MRFLISALLFCSVCIQAAPATYQDGVKAFRDGDYQAALAAFQAVRQAQGVTPALLYNLGVSHYRLQQYEQARMVFTELATHTGWQALAAYNLGLTEARLHHPHTARQYWQQVLHLKADPRLNELAAARLSEAQTDTRILLQWQGGYDSNPDQLHSSLALADGYSDLYLAAGAASRGWSASAFSRQYLRTSSPDWLQLAAEAELWRNDGAVYADVRSGLRYEQWDGVPYALTPFAELFTNYRKYDATLSARYSAGYEYRLDGEADDSLQQRLRLAVSTGGRLRGWLGFQLEETAQSDVGDGAVMPASRLMRSWLAGLHLRWRDGLDWRAQLEQRQTRYRDVITMTDLDGLDKTARREQELWRFSSDLQWRTGAWQLQAGVLISQADDNFALYDFHQHQLYAGVGYHW